MRGEAGPGKVRSCGIVWKNEANAAVKVETNSIEEELTLDKQRGNSR